MTRAVLGGGIDRQLAVLARGLAARGHVVAVATFFGGDGGPFEELVRASGEMFDARVRGRWDLARLLGATTAWIRRQEPDIVHGMNIESNLLALFAGRLRPRRRVVWGIRWDDPGVVAADHRGRAAARLHARLGAAADLVIANSHAGANYAHAIGVDGTRLRVIGNGIDSAEFTRDAIARERIRLEWGIGADEVLIGTIGMDPIKRHPAFLRAARAFTELRPRSRFVLVGEAEAAYRDRLERLADELGIGEKIVWAGQRSDMRAVYNALELTTLLSGSEGTPNSVAEAMACGVPCVVSNAGDSAKLVGDPDLVVTSVAAERVAQTWAAALDRAWTEADRLSLRNRIKTEFGLERMISESEAALSSIL